MNLTCDELLRFAFSLKLRRYNELSGVSCFCIPPHHPARRALHRLITHWAFDGAMFLLIAVSCVAGGGGGAGAGAGAGAAHILQSHVIQRIYIPRVLSSMTSYDVANNICLAMSFNAF